MPPLIQLPFEVLNLGHPLARRGLGFGTYLAYFSQLLTKPDWWGYDKGFLMNEEMTAEEKEIRQYMILVLTNLAQGQKLTNISIWELAKYLHANPDENVIVKFSGPLQEEFGCDIYQAYDFWRAWQLYTKANFAN